MRQTDRCSAACNTCGTAPHGNLRPGQHTHRAPHNHQQPPTALWLHCPLTRAFFISSVSSTYTCCSSRSCRRCARGGEPPSTEARGASSAAAAGPSSRTASSSLRAGTGGKPGRAMLGLKAASVQPRQISSVLDRRGVERALQRAAWARRPAVGCSWLAGRGVGKAAGAAAAPPCRPEGHSGSSPEAARLQHSMEWGPGGPSGSGRSHDEDCVRSVGRLALQAGNWRSLTQ